MKGFPDGFSCWLRAIRVQRTAVPIHLIDDAPGQPLRTANPHDQEVYVKTFGCQMNEYDSDKMVDVLNAAEGLEKTDTPEDADIILFNTCSVRERRRRRCSPISRVRAS